MWEKDPNANIQDFFFLRGLCGNKQKSPSTMIWSDLISTSRTTFPSKGEQAKTHISALLFTVVKYQQCFLNYSLTAELQRCSPSPQIFLEKHHSPGYLGTSIFERLVLTEMDNFRLKFNTKNTDGAYQRSHHNKILQDFSLCLFFHQPVVQLTSLQILSELSNSLKYVPNSKLVLFSNIKKCYHH